MKTDKKKTKKKTNRQNEKLPNRHANQRALFKPFWFDIKLALNLIPLKRPLSKEFVYIDKTVSSKRTSRRSIS